VRRFTPTKFGYDRGDRRKFRNVGEVIELAGCDLLPSANAGGLKKSTAVERKLSPAMAKESKIERLDLDEKKFRFLLNDDAMATEKTAEGIRNFVADTVN
jgi:transaldolase